MMPLAFRLRKQGFRANTFGYSSFFKSIQQHAEKFDRRLKQLEASESIDRWHIVAHSMGSIITRHLLCHRSYDKLGRVVMLGPPNAGSAAARRLSRLLPYSQTVRQISDDQESFVRGMPSPTDIEIGVVAASYDRVVTECSSRLQTQRDHVTVYSGHNGLLVRRSAARQVISFLRTGQFVRADG
ncbi:MAG: alpha/beta hydrolase [Planctomycetota bacterium]